MDDVFELLSKQNEYVQRVRLIPVGFQTKLNTFFDIAVVCMYVCMYVFTDREGTKCPKKTILGRR